MRGLAGGERLFEWGRRTFVMGIVNVSPESFSGDGVTDVEAAVAQALRFVEEGAGYFRRGGTVDEAAVFGGSGDRGGGVRV